MRPRISFAAGSLGLSDARRLGVFEQRISDEGIPTIVNMVDALDGYEEGGVVLETSEERVLDDGTVRRDTTVIVRFAKLGLVDQLFHTVASPAVTYLLLLIGLALLVFEFFTAGVGIAGVVGASCVVLACTGLATLPARGWAVGLLLAAMVAFAVDVQVGIPRFWTGVGIVATIIGSLWLFEPLPGRDPAAVVDHPDRRHRRHGAGVRRRHAVDGADAFRHPDDRAGVDDR